jgi:DNA-binding NarL/FixJ family response regulator
MNARLLIVDDHEVVREGLKTLLATARPEWSICGEATNGRDAVQSTLDLKPDLVLLDISMPGMSGLEAASRIRKLGISTPVLIFTTHESERLGTEVRQAGADGFVLKAQAFRDLVLAIDALLAGGTFFGEPPQAQPEAEAKQTPGTALFEGLPDGLAFNPT